jgi:hypothetical protein
MLLSVTAYLKSQYFSSPQLQARNFLKKVLLRNCIYAITLFQQCATLCPQFFKENVAP